MLAVPFHGPRQHLTFSVAAHRREIFDRLAVVSPCDILLDDGAFVEVGGDVVAGGSDELDAAGKGGVIGPGPGEGG